MKIIIAAITLLICTNSYAQDSLLTYSKVIQVDGASADKIYDQALIWCGKRFTNSNSAIRVSDKSSGIISGKAYYISHYKVPAKKDSTDGLVFAEFMFNWIIEVRSGKLRFRVSDVEHESGGAKYPVASVSAPPYKIMFQNKNKTQLEWDLSKAYFVKNMDALIADLQTQVSTKDTDW